MVDGGGTHSYQYDALYRLNQVSYPGPQTDTYTYDANGNRLSKSATTYSYDAADQMTTAGGVTYGYDNNGNQTNRGSDTFTFDHENRLTQSVISGATSSSVYNGDGLRMSHTVSGQTTNYTWDIAVGLPLVLQDGANSYVYGLDLISATDGGGAQTYFLYDGLGSITGLTDGSGNNPVSYSYDVFGAIRTQTGTSGNYWLFTGEQRDGDSSFYYLRARYYDPATGRFLGQDPIPLANLYAYVANNPINLADRSGQLPGFKEIAGATVGAVVGAGSTYVGDVAGNCDDFPECLGDIHTYRPTSSWKTYLANTAQGALVGLTCASAGPVCVGLVTGGTSIAKQAALRGEVDLCQAAIEGGAAAVGAHLGAKLFPTNRGWFEPTSPLHKKWWVGSYAQKLHGQGLAEGLLGVAGTGASGICGSLGGQVRSSIESVGAKE